MVALLMASISLSADLPLLVYVILSALIPLNCSLKDASLAFIPSPAVSLISSISSPVIVPVLSIPTVILMSPPYPFASVTVMIYPSSLSEESYALTISLTVTPSRSSASTAFCASSRLSSSSYLSSPENTLL